MPAIRGRWRRGAPATPAGASAGVRCAISCWRGRCSAPRSRRCTTSISTCVSCASSGRRSGRGPSRVAELWRAGRGPDVGTGFAQTGEGGGPPAIYNIGFLVVLIGIFYFLLIRPEQKRRREQDQLAANLKRNDQVVRSCGVHGRVVALADKVVTLEIAPNVRVQVDRPAIQSVQKGPAVQPGEEVRAMSSAEPCS